MQTETLNLRALENLIHWLFALSLVNLLFTLAVADRVRRLAKKLKGN
jgi:hypothetical protein